MKSARSLTIFPPPSFPFFLRGMDLFSDSQKGLDYDLSFSIFPLFSRKGLRHRRKRDPLDKPWSQKYTTFIKWPYAAFMCLTAIWSVYAWFKFVLGYLYKIATVVIFSDWLNC